MYNLKYKVTTSTCDSNGKLKLFSALQMMQDCSEMWIESEPIVKRYFNNQNMTQLLATRQVEVVRLPDFKEDLTVTTSVYEVKPMFGFRNTFIRDAQGVPCLKTWSMGAFVDLSTGRLKRIDEATIASITMDDKQEMNYRDRRIILPHDGGIALNPVPVMRADIDYNRHMNNAHYVRIAMELLPEDFEVKGMRMEYRVPAKLGDQLTPTIFNLGNTIIVSLNIDAETSAIIEFCNH
jgi:acyl-ACP thioesterase